MASVGRNGPPMMNGLYNNHFQIAQSPTHVVDPRRDDEQCPHHRADATSTSRRRSAPLFGDAIGRWEGDTLVVETTNFNDYHRWQDHPAYLSAKAKVTERFTRVADDELLYEFTVDDPTFYSQPWKGEVTLAQRRRGQLRIRLPRRQLRHAGHPRRRARARGAGPAAGAGNGRVGSQPSAKSTSARAWSSSVS